MRCWGEGVPAVCWSVPRGRARGRPRSRQPCAPGEGACEDDGPKSLLLWNSG